MIRKGGWGERLARLLLRGFEPAEAADVLEDLRELSAEKGGLRGALYLWVELLKYPVRMGWDRLRHREPSTRGTGKEGGMDGWWRDARYAARSLARSKGFTGMAVAIMTVSMGAATAIVGVVKGVLLDPLPVEEPDRLVSIWIDPAEGERARMTPGNFTDIGRLEGVFTGVAAFSSSTTSLDVQGEPVFLRGGRVTPEYFDVLGVRLVAGRTFRYLEADPDGPSVVVLGHRVWRQAFGADPGIVGRTISMDGVDREVIGIAPPGLYPTDVTVSGELPFTESNQDFFEPLRLNSAGWANRRSHVLGMIARLVPGVSPGTAQAALSTLSARLRATEPLNEGDELLMTSFSEEVVGDVRFALLAILGTVGLVLVIAVVNVGGLFVLRADDRRPEIAVRVAMGAPRFRLLRQLVMESALIAVASTAGAVLVARWTLHGMRLMVPYQIPRLATVEVGWTGIAVAGGMGLLIATAFGLAPSSSLFGEGWRRMASSRRQTAGRRQRRLQAAVVGIQACLGVVVLVGSVLLARSYVALRAVDVGFAAHETWVMSIPASLPDLEEIARGVRDLPGVAAAAVAYDHPLERSWGDAFLIEGVDRSEADDAFMTSLRPFGEDYFTAAGIDVAEGRVPDGIDMAGDVAYAVINETLRDLYFPTGGALGAHLILPTAQRFLGTDGRFEILGVVRDVRFLGPDQPTTSALYVPLSHFSVGASRLLVRPEQAGVDVLSGVRRTVANVDGALAVQEAQRLQDVLADLLARPRFNMMLVVTFGLMGLLLCGLGAYGLVGRVVVLRFREIGIRMALGADRVGLARSVMASALRPMVVGGAVGIAVALALVGLMRSLLFGVSPGDPVSFVASPVFVLLVGGLAAVVPTLRALSVDPASTLRWE
jgi:predicted permease